MRALQIAFFVGLLSARAALAQGTYLFTWHGNSNFFQASFQLTEAEVQPGAHFTSQLFLNSMSVTDPAGFAYHGGDSSSDGTGAFYSDRPGWWMTFQLNDFGKGTEVVVSDGLIHEEPFLGADMWFEAGHWTMAYIPEPSAVGLFGVGVAVWTLWQRRSRR